MSSPEFDGSSLEFHWEAYPSMEFHNGTVTRHGDGFAAVTVHCVYDGQVNGAADAGSTQVSSCQTVIVTVNGTVGASDPVGISVLLISRRTCRTKDLL